MKHRGPAPDPARSRHRSHVRGPRPPRRFKPTIELVGCVLGAVLLSAVGAATFDDIYTLAHRSEIVTGTVVKKDASLRRPTDVTVRFITRAGQTVVADTSRIDHEPNVGDQIQIEYDPEEPSRMQGADWGHNYWLALSAFAPAALLLTVGVLDAFPRESPPPTDRKSARRPPTD